MRLCKTEFVVEWGIAVDKNFLKVHAERCRSLAENAGEFTKRRLLDLAAHYDKRVKAAGPSAATRALIAPLHLESEPRFPGWKIDRRFATLPQQPAARTSNPTSTKMVAGPKGGTLKQVIVRVTGCRRQSDGRGALWKKQRS
jgi:hypothetical protein